MNLGSLFVLHAHGVFLNESSPRFRRLARFVREEEIGGIIWLPSSVYETAWLNARLQELAPHPLLISADLEAGLGMRFPDVTFWPPAMAVAAAGDPELAFAMGRVTAIEARAIGINHILAPVADVNVDPDNPIISTRAFGEDAAEVSTYVAAFIDGVQSEPLLACAKHFPGHGATRVDSHLALPVIDRYDLEPFRAAIRANVASIMVGHLAVPSLDPANVPATLSRPIVTGLLREELGFEGLIVSDAFDMGGITTQFDAGEAAVRAIEAGIDQILMPSDPERAIRAVEEAVRSGRIPLSRVEESLDRIATARSRVHRGVATHDEIFRVVDAAEHRALAQQIADRAVRVVRDDNGLLPLSKSARVATLVALPSHEPNPLTLLGEATLIDFHTPEEEALDAVRDADVVVLALAMRPRSYQAKLAVPKAAQRVAEELAKKTIVISFGSPYLLNDAPTYIRAYGVQEVLQRAALNLL